MRHEAIDDSSGGKDESFSRHPFVSRFDCDKSYF
jgi:hypothetical protein